MFIYEAGAMTYYDRNNCLHKGTEWRDKIDNWAKDVNVKTFNPMKTYFKEKPHTYSDSMIVQQNIYYLDKCDIMIVNLNDVLESPGTIFEMTYFFLTGKPVIAFGQNTWSPHVMCCVTQHVDTLEDAIEVLVNEFDQGNF